MPDQINLLTRLFTLSFITLLLPNLLACTDETEINNTVAASDSYIETGDLQNMNKHGYLRILVTAFDEQWLPRQGGSFNEEQELAIKLAEQLKLKPQFVYVSAFEQLIPTLIAGRADLIAANLTVTDKRKQQVTFSVPLAHSVERIVSRKNDPIHKLNKLNGREIALQAEKSYVETLTTLSSKQPAIKRQILPGHLSEDQILDQLVNKQIDLTIMDSNTLDIIASYRDDFKAGLPVSAEQSLAWAVRQDNPKLLKAINQFLNQELLSKPKQSVFTDDFSAIKKRKTLRMITRNNAASYFLWRGELLGFEYEMVKAFAKENDLRLEVIIAADHKSQIPMLLEGKGDIIASFMTVTELRKKQAISFSRPYHKSTQVIVSRAKDKKINTLEDLAGRKIHVRKSSAYWDTLQALQQSGINLKLVAAPESMETEEIISKVASGKFDLTLADDHILAIELTLTDKIRGAITLDETQNNAWLVRNNNPELLIAINNFIKKQYRSTFYNMTYDKYFNNSHKIISFRDERIDMNPDGSISPFDKLTKKYAEKYAFDWRLLTAQMYQESRFDPDATSWAGAKGLMQVMPKTATELGIKNLARPEAGIKAGVLYLDWVRDRFETELNVKDRMWFTLAAYNAGQGHVRDARRLAKQQGLNPDRWFNHVEKAMLLLSRREFSKHARHGYVRGTEPVNYVRDIRNRYRAYLRIEEEEDEY